MDPKDVNDILSMIPKGLYDPSEIVLIGSHLEPSPIGREEENSAPVGEEDGDKKTKLTADEARRTAHLRLRSDFASTLTLTAHPNIEPSSGTDKVTKSDPTVALIYAYGYEGHTYRLSKPRIMIVRGNGEPYSASADSPSDTPAGTLFVWRLSKHQQTISIEVESGELEKLVLDANKPGNRSVSAYSAHMQMSHRGGKLS